MSIGTTIKKLRRAKDITQEDLAQHLGITAKAVSQWECDRTAPDISQIPALCNFFEITADELLGIDITQKTAERDKLLQEEFNLAKNGYHAEAWELLHKGIERFPGDYEIMQSILGRAVFIINSGECSAEEEEKIDEECKRYCDLILDGCNVDHIRHSAIDSLCTYYAKRGDTDKAAEISSKMPIMCQSRDFLLAGIYTGTKNKDRNQSLKFDLIQFLVNRIPHNYQLDSGEYLYSQDETALLRDKLIALLKLVFENGDYGFYHSLLCGVHRDQARCYYAPKKDEAQVIHHLSCAVDHAIGFAEYMRQDTYTHSSLLFKGMEQNPKGVMVSNSDNAAQITLRHLDRGEYDFMRDNAELEALKERLKPYAGKNNF